MAIGGKNRDVPEKTNPVGGDLILLEDSEPPPEGENLHRKMRCTIQNLGGGIKHTDLADDLDRLTTLDLTPSTLILSDDDTDQTLTGSLGDLVIKPNKGLVLHSSKTEGNEAYGFSLIDINDGAANRASGYAWKLEPFTAIGKTYGSGGGHRQRQALVGITAEAVPKLVVFAPGNNNVWYADRANASWGADLDSTTGLPTVGSGDLTLNSGGSSITWTGTKRDFSFTNSSTSDDANLRFNVGGFQALDKQIRFRMTHTGTTADNASSVEPWFLFDSLHKFQGSQPFMRYAWEDASDVPTNYLEIGQTGQLGLKDTSAAFLVDLIYTSSSALSVKRTLTVNMVNADRALDMQLVDSLDATVTKTGNYTATLDDRKIRCDASSAPLTITLPAAADKPGKIFVIKKTDSSGNTVTVDGSGSDIDGAPSVEITVQNESITISSDGSNWDID